MSDADELAPDQIAVTFPESTTPGRRFPRPPDWWPTARLRVLAVRRESATGLSYRMKPRHREEDAATAEIRSAFLYLADSGPRAKVVLKLQRAGEASHNARSEAIKLRLNREQRAAPGTRRGAHRPDDRKVDLPRTLQPDGRLRAATEALRTTSPMVFCLAGWHALRLRGELGELEEQAHQAIRDTVGDDPACEGCQLRASIPPEWDDDNPVLPPAGHGSSPTRIPGDGRLIMPPLRLLILSDMGESLQKHLETRLTAPQVENPENAIPRKLKALHKLAETLAAIHHEGWLHLDLNLDNLCLNLATLDRLRVIDFGHAEHRDALLETFSERLPLRRVDFAAGEMQLRSFPLRVRRVNDPDREKQLRSLPLRADPDELQVGMHSGWSVGPGSGGPRRATCWNSSTSPDGPSCGSSRRNRRTKSCA